MTKYLKLFTIAALMLVSATSAHADPVPGNGCATNNQVMHSGGPENSGNAYWMVCQGGTWRQIFSVDNTGMASTNTPTAANHVATKAYVDALAGGNSYQVFTASGTFTVPAGVTAVRLTMVGGGGGGASGTGFTNAGVYAGGGGGSGGTVVNKLVSVVPGSNITVTIGAGGTSGPGNGYYGYTNGTNGGDTYFGNYFVGGGRGGSNAYFNNGPGGGPGGPSDAYSGAGGGGGSSIPGASPYGGTGGTPVTINYFQAGGGGGGGSFYGTGGNGGNASATDPGNGSNGAVGSRYGAGGGGGGGAGSSGGNGGSGANGTPGLVIVEW